MQLAAYVHWVNRLFHIIGGENLGRASQSEEESILEPKHGGRSDDGGFREDQAGVLLSSSLILAEGGSVEVSLLSGIGSTNLGTIVLRRGVQIRVEARDMNKPVAVILRDSFCNSLCALYMHILIRKVPAHHCQPKNPPSDGL